jgi:diadenosine tetraphosphatase ApaH/serine/threonine PP2A family protein phosphatase
MRQPRQARFRILAQPGAHCSLGQGLQRRFFTEQMGAARYPYASPEETDHTNALDERKTLINVGSVGQPRDGDWRACYLLLDGSCARFRRVEYDVELTIQKIREVPQLGKALDQAVVWLETVPESPACWRRAAVFGFADRVSAFFAACSPSRDTNYNETETRPAASRGRNQGRNQ